MDLPIVLSHKTAWLYHNVARPSEPLSRASSLYDEDSLANEAEPTTGLPKLGLDAKGLRASTAVGIVADYLISLGIPREELDHIDTLVNFDFERSTPAGFRCHVFGAPVPPGHLIEVAESLLVVDEAMCFVQAGSWMSEPEQLEYGYEICARYHLNHLSTDDYVEMGQRYTVADMIAYCNENRSRQGAIRAAAVLKRVHDGARSPMETATAIMIVAKRSQGGLGYAKIELNHRVNVPSEFKYLAKAGYFCEQCRLRLGLSRVVLSAGARNLLQHYSFPGNVRELEHAIHRAVVLARATRSGDEVILEAQHFAFPEVTLPPPEAAAVPVVKQNLREATEAFQRETIRQALAQNHHNWAACARMLETDVANLRSEERRVGKEC